MIFTEGLTPSARLTSSLYRCVFVCVCSTCGTPILRHASRKFSTFLRHLAMVSFGCRTHIDQNSTTADHSEHLTINSDTHHGGGGDVDAGDRPRSHVVGQVTEHHPVGQSWAQVARQRHLETRLDVLTERDRLASALHYFGLYSAARRAGGGTDLSELLHQLGILSHQRRSSGSLLLGLRSSNSITWRTQRSLQGKIQVKMKTLLLLLLTLLPSHLSSSPPSD